MSMYRQLWLAIILSMLLALAGSLLASLLSARAYLEQQLSMKNADNAAALALALSQQQPDAVTIELAVAALFDSGHYESIQVHDPQGRLLVSRVAQAGDAGAPDWFVRHLPIQSDPGEAQITNGWQQVGTVSLVSHSRFGYTALWTSTREMVAALTLASLVGGYLGSLILRRLRRPLKAVIDQAAAITNRQFVTIPEPDVPELQQLAGAMNSTVNRLKSMFEDEARRLEEVRREANFDPVTGLANREFLMAALRLTLEGERARGGSLLLIRIADLAGLNRRLGREATDEMLRRVGARVGASATALPETVAARMNGADFALLVPGQSVGMAFAESLMRQLVDAMEAFVGVEASAFIGLGSFPQGGHTGAVLARIDAALIAAEAEGAGGIGSAEFAALEGNPESGEEWGRRLRSAVDHGWLRLVAFPVVDRQRHLLHEESPLRLRLSAEGDWLPAGRFLPHAERLGMVAELDFAALELGVAELDRRPSLPGLAINLAAATLTEAAMLDRIEDLLRRHRGAATRLWLEFDETGVYKHFDAFRRLGRIARELGCKVGIEHFGRQFSRIGQLHDLGLAYVKVDGRFVQDLDRNPGNRNFLRGACSIAHAIGLQVLGEGVTRDDEFAALLDAGFDGATGPWVKTDAAT